MSINKDELVKKFARMLAINKATIFIGAGLSKANGYVDWKELLREPAQSLGLDIDHEFNFPEIAEMYVQSRGNRGGFVQEVFDQLNKDVAESENLNIIANLPLSTIWTTNYDTLIEDAFKRKVKKCYVIKEDSGFSLTDVTAEVTLIKMHGDIHSHPKDIIITRDDYEKYDKRHPVMASAFQSALSEKSFLFLGFSFTDPNLQKFLGQIRSNFGDNAREHYTIMKEPENNAYEKKKFNLIIADLKRYNIQTTVIQDFKEVTDILKDIEKVHYRKNVFVSGSYYKSTIGFPEERLYDLIAKLGEKIISAGYNLTSGMGKNIGFGIIGGALAELYNSKRQHEFHQRLNLFPFPRIKDIEEREEFFHRYRNDLIRRCGFCVFVASNSPNYKESGVLKEYRIAKEQGKILIPIGATGWAAEDIWKTEKSEGYFQTFGAGIANQFEGLCDSNKSNDEIIDAVLTIIKSLAP